MPLKHMLVMLCLISTAMAETLPQRLMPPMLDSLISAGIDQTLKQQYDDASATFSLASKEFPDHPAGFLFQAAVLQTIAMDYELRVPESAFDSLLSLVKDRAGRMVESNPESPWGYFFLGSMLGYDSYEHSQRGDWLAAATKGLSSASNFEKAIELDSSFYDAYAGMGTYYYWKTRKIEFLTWLPFIGDRRKEGIRLLEECALRGHYNRFAALSALASIQLDREDYQAAAEIAMDALRVYPSNRIFLWMLATARESGEDPEGALSAYEVLLKAIITDPRPNPYNELVCRLNLAKIKRKLGRSNAIVSMDLDAVIAMKGLQFPEHLQKRAAEKIEEAREIRVEVESR